MQVFIRKLDRLHRLTEAEKAAVLDILSPPRSVERHVDIVVEGTAPGHTTVMLEGVACRYRLGPNGERQILAFQYPGDMSDIYSYVLKVVDHSIGSLSRCLISQIKHEDIEAIGRRFPNVQYAFWRDSMVDAAIAHAWMLNIGRRTPLQRLAHLFCEQFARLEAVGLAQKGHTLRLGITQHDLSDAMGLSLVHVNRTLQQMRASGLIELEPQAVQIIDWEELQRVAVFDPAYLHYLETND